MRRWRSCKEPDGVAPAGETWGGWYSLSSLGLRPAHWDEVWGGLKHTWGRPAPSRPMVPGLCIKTGLAL